MIYVLAPEYVGPVTTALTGLGGLALGWGAQRIANRAQKASEKNEAHSRDEAAFSQVKDLASYFERLWRESEAKQEVNHGKVEALRDEMRNHKDEFSDFKFKFRALERKFFVAIDVIRQFVLWAETVDAPKPHPIIPDSIADLVDTKPANPNE